MKINKFLYIIMLFRRLISLDSLCAVLKIRRKPVTLQLPITSRCNSRCVTCNVWKKNTKFDIDSNNLKECLTDPYFSKVKNVGINGGEFSLVKDFDRVLDAVLVLPRLKDIYIISNGLLPQKILTILEYSKQKCEMNGIKLNFTLSVDGFGDVQNMVRGVPKAFKATQTILDSLVDEPLKYAHSISIGSTLSIANIAYIRQLETFLAKYPFPAHYHLAVPNKRIDTFSDSEKYYILCDEHSRMLAQEYFYNKFIETETIGKFSYFAQYYFLKNRGKGRLTSCQYKYKDLTIDESLNLYLCATASEIVGDLNQTPASTLVTQTNCRFVEQAVQKQCDTCIHYIYDEPTLKGLVCFISEIIKRRIDNCYKYERI